jgi:hypothetical protein
VDAAAALGAAARVLHIDPDRPWATAITSAHTRLTALTMP